ncbi:MAG: hypothetical protein ABFS03_09175 [Chloroflexota bacterium]
MNQKNKEPIKFEGGLFREISNQFKLIVRLMSDPRINFGLKLLPFISTLYFIFPDIVPGPIDDAFVIGIGTYIFIELCPPEIVQEHRDALSQTIGGQWRDPNDEEGEVIDGKFKEE